MIPKTVLLFLFLLPLSIFAQFPRDTSFYNSNGNINDVVIDKDTMYLGGNFTYFGPVNPNACLIKATDQLPYLFPHLNSPYILAATADGNGGWFVGGAFDTIGGVTRQNLAHVLPNGLVDSWNPSPNGNIESIAFSFSYIVVGGSFSMIAGQTRNNLAVFDRNTLALTSFNLPFGNSVTEDVKTIATHNDIAYVGGGFDSVNFQPRVAIAKINLATNTLLPWDPQIDPNGGLNGNLSTSNVIRLYQNRLLIAGYYYSMQNGAINAPGFSMVDTSSASAIANNAGFPAEIRTMEIIGNDLVAGGGSSPFGFIRRYSISMDTMYSWDPFSFANPGIGSVNAICKTGNYLTIAGDFPAYDHTPVNYLAFVDTINFKLLDTTKQPVADNIIQLVSYDASTKNILLNGDFTSCGGMLKNNFVKYNLAQNTIEPFKAQFNYEVLSLAKYNGRLYVGGMFDSMLNITTAKYLIELDAMGNPTWWPDPDNYVYKLLATQNKLFVGGNFLNILGNSNPNLAVIDLNSKQLISNPSSYSPANPVTEMLVEGSRLFVVQNASSIDKVDIPTYIQLPFNPTFVNNGSPSVNSLGIFSDKLVVAGGFNTVNGVNRGGIALIDTVTGTTVSGFDAQINYVQKAIIQNELCYAFGYFSSAMGIPRNNFAVVDLQNALLLNGDPLSNILSLGAATTMAMDKYHVYFFGSFVEPIPFYFSWNTFYTKRAAFPSFNRISGTIFNDLNANGIKDVSEYGISNALVNVNSGNFFAATNAAGKYSLHVDPGTYNLTPVLPVNYSTLCTPGSHNAVFTSLAQADSSNDFALQLQGNVSDVSVSLSTIGVTRRGYDYFYEASVRNDGTNPQTGKVSLFFSNPDVVYMASSPAYDSLSGQTYFWHFTNLLPGETRNMLLQCQINSWAPLGSFILSNASVIGSGTDVLQANNTDTLVRTIVASLDPNFKEVAPEGTGINGFIPLNTPKLEYTVHFQNTGSDTAINIVVADTISAKLDPTSLSILNASHPYWLEVQNRVLKMHFDNIHLPDSTTNELLSHGMFKYSLNPVAVSSGDVVKNTAYIYFDYNTPVITNTTINTFQNFVGISENTAKQILIYPNPASKSVAISCQDALREVSLTTSLGEHVCTIHPEANFCHMNLTTTTPGIYFIRITHADGLLTVHKLVIN